MKREKMDKLVNMLLELAKVGALTAATCHRYVACASSICISLVWHCLLVLLTRAMVMLEHRQLLDHLH